MPTKAPTPKAASEVVQSSQPDALPPAVAAHLAALGESESAEATRAASALEAAWAEVERVIALNQQREATLAALDADLDAFKDVQFWTPEALSAQFGLTTNDDEEGGLVIDGLNTGDEEEPDVRQSVTAKAAADRPPLTGSSRAKDAAHYAPAADTLAPIRRCFTSLLSRRNTDLPVEFTLLLNGLEQLQKRVVPVEERMNKSRFKLPLHVPFRAIAQLITRTLVPQPTGADLERWLKEEALANMKALQAAYADLEAATDAKHVYAQLDHEAIERRRLHEVCMDAFGRAVQIEANMLETFTAGQRKATEQCDAALRYVREHAEQITTASASLVEEVDNVESRGVAAVAVDAAETDRLLKEAEYRAKRARKNQETAARQAREAMKSFHKEQQAHATAIADVARLRVEAARMNAARAQFVESCKARREILADAHRACLFVNDVIADVAEEVRTGLTLCQQHVSRMLAEESYRKARIASEPIKNARDWFRALGDLKTIRAHRRADIQRRMEGSWQLEFLLSQENDAHGAAIDALNEEIAHVSREWVRLTGILVDLEVHAPVLHQYDKDATVVRMRGAFTAIEGIGKDKDMREAHRKLLAIEAADAEARQQQLPPMPPVRPSRIGVTKTRDLATGVRHVPRPPSATAEKRAADSSEATATPAATARVSSASRRRKGSAGTKRTSPPPTPQTASQTSEPSTPDSKTASILPQRSPRGARAL